MDLRLGNKEINGATVLEVSGELELHTAPQLRATLARVAENEPGCVVVDLSAVTFIDSTGIGVLVGAFKRLRERGGDLVLVCPTPRVRRVFEIAGLLRALPLHETTQDALNSCRVAHGQAAITNVELDATIPEISDGAASAPQGRDHA